MVSEEGMTEKSMWALGRSGKCGAMSDPKFLCKHELSCFVSCRQSILHRHPKTVWPIRATIVAIYILTHVVYTWEKKS